MLSLGGHQILERILNRHISVSAYQGKSLREVYEGYEEATFRYSKLHCNRTMLFEKNLRIKSAALKLTEKSYS